MYLLIGHTQGDDLISPKTIVLSEPSDDKEALKVLGKATLKTAQEKAQEFYDRTNGAYANLWLESVLAKVEVIALEPGKVLSR